MMTGEDRRQAITNYLINSSNPISGSELAKKFQVSRQVIVQDIALLRSANKNILSTNRGYLIPNISGQRAQRVFKCCHTDEQTEDELTCIVDQGGIIENVFVNHKIYGRIQADMHICSRRDIRDFMDGIHNGKSNLLKNITSDYHYHCVSAENDKILDAIEEELIHRNYLIQPINSQKKI